MLSVDMGPTTRIGVTEDDEDIGDSDPAVVQPEGTESAGAPQHCSPTWIAIASASALSVYCIFMTPAKRAHDAGAACSYAGTVSRSQRMRLVNARSLTNDDMVPTFLNSIRWIGNNGE
jgi:hypothetical protein